MAAAQTPERAIDPAIQLLQLGELAPENEAVRQELAQEEPTPDLYSGLLLQNERGYQLYATPYGRLAISPRLSGTHKEHFIPTNIAARLLGDPNGRLIPPEEREPVMHPHSHPAITPISAGDVINLLRSKGQPLGGSIGVMVLWGDYTDALYRGKNTPLWDWPTYERRWREWTVQQYKNYEARIHPGMSQQELHMAWIGVQIEFEAWAVREFDMHAFHGDPGSTVLYKWLARPEASSPAAP